ncbi:MAG: ABC transporter ATP-binding protein [Clostridia bacterium]
MKKSYRKIITQKNRETGSSSSTVKRLLKYTSRYKFLIFFAFVCALINVAMSLFAPFIIGKAIDNIISVGNVNFEIVLYYLIILSIVILIGAVFGWVLSLFTNKITYGAVKDIRSDIFSKLSSVPLKTIDNNSHGNLISTIVTDADAVSDGLLQGSTQLFSGVITIFATIGFMLSVNYIIALIVIVLTPLSILVTYFIARGCHNMFTLQSQTRGEMTGLCDEMINGQKLVKAFCFEQKTIKDFEQINMKLYDYGLKSQFYSALTNPSTRFVNAVVYAGVLIGGAISIISGNLSVGVLSCFLSYANQYTKPFNEISGVLTQVQSAVASATRIFKVLDFYEEQDDKDAQEINNCDQTIKIKNLKFYYNSSKPLIKNFNLDVRGGQRVAIVGPTGCGKTTLINLLMGFYQPIDGEIIISGKEISKIKKQSLRQCFGMVLQDAWFFSGTIKENIAYSKQNATFNEIVWAAKQAHAHSFIEKLPQGYDTIITSGGVNLSAGQKQLLQIARVMLSSPPMLILDEATSNIDTRTEIKIQAGFEQIMQNKTSFIVAHRLSTIKQADIILVMKDGDIIEKGNHNSLLKEKGFYYNLYNSQFENQS